MSVSADRALQSQINIFQSSRFNAAAENIIFGGGGDSIFLPMNAKGA
jgi:hypothetical protein